MKIKATCVAAVALTICLLFGGCAPIELIVVQEELDYMQSPSLNQVTIGDGFWQERRDTVYDSTLPYSLDFCEPPDGKPYIWYKDPGYPCNTPLIEGAAGYLAVQRDEELESRIDRLFALAAEYQDEDGYIHFIGRNSADYMKNQLLTNKKK